MTERIFGVGLRTPHHQYVLENLPKLDFFEIHTENFICDGGPLLNFLDQIAENYKLSFHSVGLSLGSDAKPDKVHLKGTKALLDRYKPFLFSDHLSWSNSKDRGISNDLLPVPYSKESLRVMSDNIKHVQDYFGRVMMIENPSAYLEFKDSEMAEVDFLNELSHKASCNILLDVNNVFVSAYNFGFDAENYLRQIDASKVQEIHLAGHTIVEYAEAKMRIDTHSTYVCDEVSRLFKDFIKRTNVQIPILVEWDEEIPEFEILYKEMEKARELV